MNSIHLNGKKKMATNNWNDENSWNVDYFLITFNVFTKMAMGMSINIIKQMRIIVEFLI